MTAHPTTLSPGLSSSNIPTPPATMIDIQGVSKYFGKLAALQEVNLQLEAGQCIALIGPNGCGKTTLIKSILGLVLPSAGTIAFQGKAINRAFDYRRYIGYMPQIGRYPENMTIGQVVDMIKVIRAPVAHLDEQLLEQFHLADLFHKRMGVLSGGTTQKVSASLAFLFDPQVLILDEPTAGLDPLAAELLKEKIIQEKARGKLILITSHLLTELDDLVSQIIFMQEGRVRFHQSVEALMAAQQVDRLSRAITQILKQQNP